MKQRYSSIPQAGPSHLRLASLDGMTLPVLRLGDIDQLAVHEPAQIKPAKRSFLQQIIHDLALAGLLLNPIGSNPWTALDEGHNPDPK
ncbi:hypothetical protein [Rhizobium aegyptiacum]|uniref:hypothetical protein n=1 Tax=Rhizobium aegyptiacum TaxID=1764550 RepID=UPI0007E57D88|nr:hypothetical protein [Rhizobium aegyptiacum]